MGSRRRRSSATSEKWCSASGTVREMGSNGRVVLVAEAVLAGDVPDATAELEQRVAAKLGREKRP